jgi:hypothetical protein
MRQRSPVGLMRKNASIIFSYKCLDCFLDFDLMVVFPEKVAFEQQLRMAVKR